jgi:hypothetical protein
MDTSSPYRLLYFHANQLERWETIEASNELEAVEKAARRPSDDRAELWVDDKRIASFRPVGAHPKR